ncbi:Pancreatic lipase- protein 2 [Bulinus truncatus]|nr:Pancreatic lipase- protein 2 [Bulinus truncatus]
MQRRVDLIFLRGGRSLLPVLCLMFTLYGRTMAATRCYGDLGCFDSGSLMALPQDPSFIRTQFQVSCPNHTDSALIDATGDPDTVKRQLESSCFQVYRDTQFIIHGYNEDVGAQWLLRMRDGLLNKGDYNVIIVDWHHGSRFPYEQAAANMYLVARQLAKFLRLVELILGLAPPRMHLIGYSLGAQLAGATAAALSPTKVSRITGLDPAEPYFDDVDDNSRLDLSDAIFVDVIHTDGETFTGSKGYGSLRAQGHVDFYPNGGEKQPGCVSSDIPGLLPGIAWDQTNACSHSRSYDLFIESLGSSSGSCKLIGYPCSSWSQFEAGNCTSCSDSGCPRMGFDVKPSDMAEHNYFLSTASRRPFCGVSYIVNLTLSPTQGHSYGRIFMTLTDVTGHSDDVDFSRSDRHYHSGHSEQHVVTVTANLTDIASVHLLFVKGSGLSSVGTSDRFNVHRVSVQYFDNSNRTKVCSNESCDLQSGIKTKFDVVNCS